MMICASREERLQEAEATGIGCGWSGWAGLYPVAKNKIENLTTNSTHLADYNAI